MELDEYQKQAWSTAIYHMGLHDTRSMSYAALGLNDKAGEIAGHVSKILRDDNTYRTPERIAKIQHDAGGALWFLSAVCVEFQLSLDGVATANLSLLSDRKERGVLKGDGRDR